MGQLLTDQLHPFRANLAACQIGGSLSDLILSSGEYLAISTKNTIDERGNGVIDAYIIGDGENIVRDLLSTMKALDAPSGYSYAGVAYTNTDPGNIRGNVYYIAIEEGTYDHFGGLICLPGEVPIFKTSDNGQTWIKDQTNLACSDTVFTTKNLENNSVTMDKLANDAKVIIVSHEVSENHLTELTPNVLHTWSGNLSELTIDALATPEHLDIMNEYMVQFTTADDWTQETNPFPSTVRWANFNRLRPNFTYQVSIVNNLGVILEVEVEV